MIFIVIVNYHCQDLVCASIGSILEHVDRDVIFVVVDNSEVPDSERLLLEHPGIALLEPGENLGFAGGVNVGLRYALDHGAEHVLLLNPDTRVEHDFLSPLVSALDENGELGVVGPTIYMDDSKKHIWSAGGEINWWLGRPSNVRDKRFIESSRIVSVPFVSGCAMLLRSQVIRQVGPMDDSYFLYFEDADFVMRIVAEGWGAGYVPKSEIYHAASSTTGFQSESYVYFFSRNRIWFMRRWARWHHFLFFCFFTVMVKIPGAIGIFGIVRRQPKLVKAFLKGCFDGFLRIKR